jgi:membrane protease YdiL (CAAX protease family)
MAWEILAEEFQFPMPYHFAGIRNPSLEQLFHTAIGLFFLRFVFTWLFNRTKGGIMSGVLLHTSANVATTFIPITYTQIVVVALIAVIVIIGDRMWKTIPPDNENISRESF